MASSTGRKIQSASNPSIQPFNMNNILAPSSQQLLSGLDEEDDEQLSQSDDDDDFKENGAMDPSNQFSQHNDNDNDNDSQIQFVRTSSSKRLHSRSGTDKSSKSSKKGIQLAKSTPTKKSSLGQTMLSKYLQSTRHSKHSQGDKGFSADMPLGTMKTHLMGRSTSRLPIHSSSTYDEDEDDYGNRKSNISSLDPSYGLQTLPLYMRGGSNVGGFGKLLGYALALLLVVRHGLRENELWSILATLRKQKMDKEAMHLTGGDDMTEEMERLVQTLNQVDLTGIYSLIHIVIDIDYAAAVHKPCPVSKLTIDDIC